MAINLLAWKHCPARLHPRIRVLGHYKPKGNKVRLGHCISNLKDRITLMQPKKLEISITLVEQTLGKLERSIMLRDLVTYIITLIW